MYGSTLNPAAHWSCLQGTLMWKLPLSALLPSSPNCWCHIIPGCQRLPRLPRNHFWYGSVVPGSEVGKVQKLLSSIDCNSLLCWFGGWERISKMLVVCPTPVLTLPNPHEKVYMAKKMCPREAVLCPCTFPCQRPKGTGFFLLVELEGNNKTAFRLKYKSKFRLIDLNSANKK